MARQDLSAYAEKVLIEAPPTALGIKTFSCTTNTVYPGYVVTTTGETDPDVVVIGAADDVSTGIALLKPNHDPDTAYAAGEFIPVALCGSGAVVWTYLKRGVASVVVGTPIHNDGGTPTVYGIVGEGRLYEHIGFIIEYSATSATDDRLVKVRLS